jgi:hypothetical protein
MLGQVYLRYSDRFGKKPHSATLKKKLGQFKLSNLVLTLARINVLLGWRRMLGENREDKKSLQGLLVANFIDDDLLNAPLPPQLANEFLAGHPSPQLGHLPPDLVPIFSRQQVLNLLRLGILFCNEQGTLLTDGKTAGGRDLGMCCLMMNDHLLSVREERAISKGSDAKRRKHIGMQLAPILELYNPPSFEKALVRSDIIFSELVNSQEMQVHVQKDLKGFDLSKAFVNATGISLDMYRELTLSMFSSLLARSYDELVENPSLFVFKRSEVLKESLIDQKDFDRYLSLDCMNLKEAKALFSETNRKKLLKQFDYVRFRSRPLLELENEMIVCADLCFLVEKLSSGIYWTIVDSLKGKDKDRALQSFGYLFEIYVNQLLRRVSQSNGTLIASPKYKTGELSFDGLICHGNHLIVLEYKGGFMEIEAKYSGKVRAFEKALDMKFGVNEGVSQLAKHIGRLYRDRQSDRDQIEELDQLLRNSHSKIEKITPVLIVRESLLRFSAIEEILSKRFVRLLAREKVSRSVDVAPLAVLDIDTLEEMMANLVAGDFTLQQCLNARALRDPGYRSMWYDFLLEHFPEFRKRKDENLMNKFGEIMDRGKARLFGSAAGAGSS